MRHTERLAPDHREASDNGVLQRVAHAVPADHSGGADEDEALLAGERSRRHDNGRSSTQSTYRRRSENSHAPSIFANVSR